MFFKTIIENLNVNNRLDLASYIECISEKDIFIYGAGCFGRELQKVFQQHSVFIKGFIDRNAGNISAEGVPVFYPSQVDNKREIRVIIGIVMDKKSLCSLKFSLHEMGYEDVIDGQSIRAHYVYALHTSGEEDPKKYFSERIYDIEKAYSLLEDNESRVTYSCNLRAHILREYQDCRQVDSGIQYFAQDIPFQKGYSRFIDCGAYIGDTLQELCEYNLDVKMLAAFEPNSKNFSRLANTYYSELKERIAQAYFFPCGVSDVTMLKKFAEAGGSSSVTDTGDAVVQCVALDDALPDFAPTFIKMDIEGAEYSALLGAKRMIDEYRPDLAICVYHIIDDFFRIPLLLDSWNLGYKFYLRGHSSCCMENVLYAVSEG